LVNERTRRRRKMFVVEVTDPDFEKDDDGQDKKGSR